MEVPNTEDIMKKILALSLVAIATAVGCTSPSDNLCLESAECAGEEDPAQFCADAKADQDEDAKACSDACKSEGDALAQCVLDNGKCEEIEGTDVKAFGLATYGDECKDQAEAAATCAEDNC